jgi:hypothetical protein
MLRVFGDESHDPKCERVFAVAILFGTDAEWEQFSTRWNGRLGGKIFHASDCETDHGDFAQASHAENLKLYADLTKIICESRLLGFASAMDLQGYREFFPDALDDIPYYRCFRDVIVKSGEWAKMAIPQEVARVIFDQRMKSNYNAGVLYEYMVRTAKWEASAHLEKTISFESRSIAGIQAADLLAREMMKHLDNIVGPVKRPERRSMEALRKTQRIGGDLHLRDFFQDFRRQFDDVSARVGMSAHKYREWLRARGLSDSISSRHMYLIDSDTGLPQTPGSA